VLYNRSLIKQDKVYVMAQPMLAWETFKTFYFMGQNILQFVKQYKQLYI